MTLQNATLDGGRAYLWADTGFYDRSGTMLFEAPKAFEGLFWPYAGVMASNGGNPHEIAAHIGAEAPDAIPALLDVTVEALRRYATKGYSARVLLATWQDRPQLWLVATDEAAGEPFVPCEVQQFLAHGSDHPEIAQHAKYQISRRIMRRVIDLQLEHPVELAGSFASAGKRIWYGGSVIEVAVGRRGVESSVLRECPAQKAALVGDPHGSR